VAFVASPIGSIGSDRSRRCIVMRIDLSSIVSGKLPIEASAAGA